MIHIADTKVARRYGDFFIRQIHKFEEVRGQREVCGPGTEVRDFVGSFNGFFFFNFSFLFSGKLEIDPFKFLS